MRVPAANQEDVLSAAEDVLLVQRMKSSCWAADSLTSKEVEMDLILGGVRNHQIRDAEKRLAAFRSDPGYRYYSHVPNTPAYRLLPEDLAVPSH